MPSRSPYRTCIEEAPAGREMLSIAESQTWLSQKSHDQATRAATVRSVSGRRRFVDPTTCEIDYSDAQLEFMHAMQDYKRRSGRMFPTWNEVLEVLKSLGYKRSSLPPDIPSLPPASTRFDRRFQIDVPIHPARDSSRS
jgi:hypothetical protein